MAVEYLLEDEDEENQTSTGGGEQIAGAPALMSGQSQPQDNPGTSSGSYTNFQKYIEANKGRDFGGQVAGKIQEGVDTGVNKLSTAETQFRGDVDKNTISFDDGLKQKISDSPQMLSGDEQTQAKTIREGSYKGPTDFSGGVDDDPYSELRRYFGGLEETKNASSEGLLKKYYDRPSYTKGEKSLDAYILGQQRQPVEKAKAHLGSAIDTYGQKKNELGEYAKAGKGKTDTSRSDYYSLLGLDPSGSAAEFKRGTGQTGLIQKDLDRLYGQAEKRRGEASSGFSNLKSAGRDLTNPSTSIYENFGGLDRLYGVDPSQYLNVTPSSNINYQTAATPQDLARLTALTQLAGLPQDYLNPSAVGTQDDEALMSFDKNRFMDAVNAKKAEFEQALKNPVAMKAGNYSGGIEDVLNKARGDYDYATDQWNRVYANNQGSSNPQYMMQNVIKPYEELLKQREDLRNRYGYYDLVRR